MLSEHGQQPLVNCQIVPAFSFVLVSKATLAVAHLCWPALQWSQPALSFKCPGVEGKQWYKNLCASFERLRRHFHTVSDLASDINSSRVRSAQSQNETQTSPCWSAKGGHFLLAHALLIGSHARLPLATNSLITPASGHSSLPSSFLWCLHFCTESLCKIPCTNLG